MRWKKGFTIIELSMALVIISVLSGAGLTTANYYLKKSTLETTKTKLEKIQEALEIYQKVNGFLPCPSPLNVDRSNTSFGVSTAHTTTSASMALNGYVDVNSNAVRIGAVPTTTLNLPPSYSHDAWNSKYTYAVTRDLCLDSATYGTTVGAISIVNKDNVSLTASGHAAAYAVVSHGKLKKGAYNTDGTTRIACGSTEKDSENCNDDQTFRDMRIVEDHDTIANYSDDIILWLHKNYIGISAGGGGGSSDHTTDDNVHVGEDSFDSNTTGDQNTVIGKEGLNSNTTGSHNAASGYQALYSNTTGDHNIASGALALFNNTTGSDNTASGYETLHNNTTGSGHTASGSGALRNNTTGSDNTANGYQALFTNSFGNHNTASGYQALFS